MPGENDENTTPRDIIVNKSEGGIKRINSLNCHYDPLHYVLLFPRAESGFEINLPYSNTNYSKFIDI